MRRLLLLPLTLCAVYAGGCAQSIASRVLVPQQSEEQREWLAEQRRQVGRRVGDRLKGVDYRSPDGTHLAALMILPDQSPRGVVVCLHGLTERKEAMLPVAEAFADAGYIAVAPDFRAHGSSGGRYTSLGYHEKIDMVALLDYLAAQGCDVSRTGVLGGSLGAAVALQWAGIDPRVKTVIAVASFSDLNSELDHMYRANHVNAFKAFLLESAAQREGQFRIKDVSPIAAVQAVQTPILLAHGRQDDIIPATESRKLFDAARGPVALFEVDARHMDIREKLGAKFTHLAIEWMDAYVNPMPRTDTPPTWVADLPTRHMPTNSTVTMNKDTTPKS
jgi:dipeptidyl aminopeptidase/acylaminoacyl peptidase